MAAQRGARRSQGTAGGPGGAGRRDAGPAGPGRRAGAGRRPAAGRGPGGRADDPPRRTAYDVLAAVHDREAYANLLLPRLLTER